MASPLKNLDNLGNTCWCASAVQALRSVRVFAKQFPKTTLLGRVLNDETVSSTLVDAFYKWARSMLTESTNHSQEDPAEFLVQLFDRKDVSEAAFCSKRHKVACCSRCCHVRSFVSEESLLIVPYLPKAKKPLRKAIHSEFGFKVNMPNPQAESAESAAELRDAPPPIHERWWRCDDNIITEVKMTSAAPYLLFYAERNATLEPSGYDSEASDEDSVPTYEDIKDFISNVDSQSYLSMDCEGDCKKKTPHAVFVNSYETSSAVIVHVSIPRYMNLARLERVLFESDGECEPFDLVAIICRVGGSHYVCYRKYI